MEKYSTSSHTSEHIRFQLYQGLILGLPTLGEVGWQKIKTNQTNTPSRGGLSNARPDRLTQKLHKQNLTDSITSQW